MSTNYAARVPIPANSAINGGLSNAGNCFLEAFGRPGRLTTNCSSVTNEALLALMTTRDVGPFRAYGLRPAVESLERLFARVHHQKPELYKSIKTAGMTCCRLIRGAKSTFSIHSWGGAIDLYCGSGVVPLGAPYTHQGVLELYPYFHNEGWYWGAEFSRDDAMHMEVARQTFARWKANGFKTEIEKVCARCDKADVLIVNDHPVAAGYMQEYSWMAPRRDIRLALGLDPGPDSLRVVALREELKALDYQITAIGDHRTERNRFYVYAAKKATK